jgi:hypothetical protein
LQLYPLHAGAASALTLGLLTALGGFLTFVVAKLPVTVDYALPLFILSLCLMMVLSFCMILKGKATQAVFPP